MMPRLTKALMKAALDAAATEYEENATVAQLLPLYYAIAEDIRIDFELANGIRNAGPERQDGEINQDDNEGEIDAESNVSGEPDADADANSEIDADADADAELDSELRQLQKRRDILLLKKQLRELERDENMADEQPPMPAAVQAHASIEMPIAAAPLSSRRTDFRDVEHAIVKFSGDDPSQDVHEFLRDYEEVMRIVNADATLKLLGLRRSLDGAIDRGTHI